MTMILMSLTAPLSGVTVSAAPYGSAGTGMTEMLYNMFVDWKVWAAILSVVVLCTAGIFQLGRARLAGVLLIAGGLFLGVFFARIEHFIQLTQNTEQNWERPSTSGNPFQRG